MSLIINISFGTVGLHCRYLGGVGRLSKNHVFTDNNSGHHVREYVTSLSDFNPFMPEFLKWTLVSLNLDMSTDAKRIFSLKSKSE